MTMTMYDHRQYTTVNAYTYIQMQAKGNKGNSQP